MKFNSMKLLMLLAALLVITGACKANISPNGNGSYSVETSITQEQLQQVITASIADPLVKDITVTLKSGYALVSGTRARLNEPGKTDTLSFRLDLGASNGMLTSTILDAQLDGIPIDQTRVDLWNQTIANRISLLGQKNPNTTLQSVTINPSMVTMTWNVARQ